MRVSSDVAASSHSSAPTRDEIAAALKDARTMNGIRYGGADSLSVRESTIAVLERAYTHPDHAFIDEDARLDVERLQVNLAGALSRGSISRADESNVAKLLIATSGQMQHRYFQESMLENLSKVLLKGHGGSAQSDIAEHLLDQSADHQDWLSLEDQRRTFEAPAFATSHRNMSEVGSTWEPTAEYQRATAHKISSAIANLPEGSINRGILARSAIQAIIDRNDVPNDLRAVIMQRTSESLHKFPAGNEDYSLAALGLAKAARRSRSAMPVELRKQLDALSRNPHIIERYRARIATITALAYGKSSLTLVKFVRGLMPAKQFVGRAVAEPYLFTAAAAIAEKHILQQTLLELENAITTANHRVQKTASKHQGLINTATTLKTAQTQIKTALQNRPPTPE